MAQPTTLSEQQSARLGEMCGGSELRTGPEAAVASTTMTAAASPHGSRPRTSASVSSSSSSLAIQQTCHTSAQQQQQQQPTFAVQGTTTTTTAHHHQSPLVIPISNEEWLRLLHLRSKKGNRFYLKREIGTYISKKIQQMFTVMCWLKSLYNFFSIREDKEVILKGVLRCETCQKKFRLEIYKTPSLNMNLFDISFKIHFTGNLPAHELQSQPADFKDNHE